jgi:DNA polymerase-3 subunit alpha (Gram-positive type)
MTHDSVIIVLDTETGGLSPKTAALAEIALCPFDMQTLEDLQEYSTLIKPYNENLEYNPKALEANGLTMDQINSGNEAKEVVKNLKTYLKSFKRGRNKPILAAHNAKFDIGFIEAFFSEFNVKIWDYFEKSCTLDTMWLGRLTWKESVNFKLGTCCQNAGIDLVNAHRALNDTRATKNLVKFFINNLRTTGGDSIETTEKFREQFEF